MPEAFDLNETRSHRARLNSLARDCDHRKNKERDEKERSFFVLHSFLVWVLDTYRLISCIHVAYLYSREGRKEGRRRWKIFNCSVQEEKKKKKTAFLCVSFGEYLGAMRDEK